MIYLLFILESVLYLTCIGLIICMIRDYKQNEIWYKDMKEKERIREEQYKKLEEKLKK